MECLKDCIATAAGTQPAALIDEAFDRGATSQMTSFTTAFEAETGRVFGDHASLHDFAARDFRAFWRFFVQWSKGLDASGFVDPVCLGEDCETARFFPELRLNYAENLLGSSIADADAPAITAVHADGRRLCLTRGELREQVESLAQSLTELGIGEGDCIVGVMRNDARAAIAALAVAAVGATLATAAPEMGVPTLLDRFAPLAPTLLMAHTAAQGFDVGLAVPDNVAAVAAALPSLKGVLSLDDGALPDNLNLTIHSLGGLIEHGDSQRFVWQRFAFDHPLFIMFSSGTTGKPKCIIHGAGGVLVEHLKEHRLHCDLQPGDRMYFHTSCAWMMWNWQLSALASGVELVTYDGPISSVDTLWRLVAAERVSMFGTSPAYLRMGEEAGLVPSRQFDLTALRAVLSTGAILHESQFQWVWKCVKPLPLWTISGGTDILGCFVLGNPNQPVHAGQAQCRSLALDVQAWTDHRETVGIGQLVCVNPFPSRPLGFHGDMSGAAFHAAYFESNSGVWTHGDLIEFTHESGVRMHGRSDGVLNVRGINVGPAEIYVVVNDIPGIREAIVVQQRKGKPVDAWSESRTVLILVMADEVKLTKALMTRIRRDIMRRASAAHVPDLIISVSSLPVTHSGKLSERAAGAAVNGLAVANTGALRNPECLDAIRNHPALHSLNTDLPSADVSLMAPERQLQLVWEDVFGFAPIGRGDNFFELGGHSLLAARLLHKVEELTGCKLPLSTMVTAPTISGLLSVINERREFTPSSVLVPMRDGVGMPIFIVHGVTGTVMECIALVRALNSTRPVFGLQAPGLDGEEPVQRRVEHIAATYIEHMRTVQPSGPYSIVGYSFGGLIALEVAQILQRNGEQMQWVCLLDTYVHERCLPWLSWLRFQCGYVGRQFRALSELSQADQVVYVRAKLGAAADRIRMRVGQRARRPEVNRPDMSPVLLHVRETMRVAMTMYRPRPYEAGPVVYVRAANMLEGRGDPLPLWQRLARGGLKIVDVQGDHLDMMREPNVQHVAAALDQIDEPGAAKRV